MKSLVLLIIISFIVVLPGCDGGNTNSESPASDSSLITDIERGTGSVTITNVETGTYQINAASHGDTFDPAWAEDDNLYCAGNDGYGFNLNSTSDNINFNKLSGSSPVSLLGQRFESLHGYGASGNDSGHGDWRNWKSSGTLCLNGTLYLAVSRAMYQDWNYGGRQSHIDCSIIKSTDKGQSWTRSEATNYSSPMFSGQRFATPFFIHYGKDGSASVHNADQYVYAISNNGFWDNGDNYILGRVPRSAIGNLSAADWQFYTGGDGMQASSWSSNMNNAQLIINDPAKCGETGATYIPALGRYVLVAWYYPNGNGHGSYLYETCFAFWESPTPWGPWKKVTTTVNNPSGWYVPRLLAKFQTQDGNDVSAYIACAGNWADNSEYTDSRNHFYKFSIIPIILKTSGYPPVVVDDNTTGTGLNQFEYVGSWSYQTNRSSAFGSTEHYSNTANDYLQVRFNGTKIKFYSSKAGDMGKAAISIDGGAETIVDFYNSSTQWQQLVYDSGALSAGSHTLKVRLSGQKNASSSGYWICADKVEISIETPDSNDTTPPAKVTGLSATAASSSQINLSWTANTESDLSGYRVYRNGSLVGNTTGNSYSDTGLASGTTYQYQVSAVDKSGNEGQKSNAVSATTKTSGSCASAMSASPATNLLMMLFPLVIGLVFGLRLVCRRRG